MSLTARHLEQQGVTTVVVGSARDIVEECGVPRFVFTDFPLGNPLGAPRDAETQMAVLRLSLQVAQQAFAPRTTVQAPVVWPHGDEWRATFMEIVPKD